MRLRPREATGRMPAASLAALLPALLFAGCAAGPEGEKTNPDWRAPAASAVPVTAWEGERAPGGYGWTGPRLSRPYRTGEEGCDIAYSIIDTAARLREGGAQTVDPEWKVFEDTERDWPHCWARSPE